MFEYLPELMKGLHTSLTLTVASLIVALILALIFTGRASFRLGRSIRHCGICCQNRGYVR